MTSKWRKRAISGRVGRRRCCDVFGAACYERVPHHYYAGAALQGDGRIALVQRDYVDAAVQRDF